MSKRTYLLAAFALSANILLAQVDTSGGKGMPDVFTRLTSAMKGYKPDTSAAPDDKLTRAINRLSDLGGGFNINEAIDFKITEDRQKGELSAAEGDKLAAFFKTGNGRRWLDNAVTWIYREQFIYSEIKQLIRFYKKPAGQKMAASFPLIMLQSLMAAETIKAGFESGTPIK